MSALSQEFVGRCVCQTVGALGINCMTAALARKVRASNVVVCTYRVRFSWPVIADDGGGASWGMQARAWLGQPLCNRPHEQVSRRGTPCKPGPSATPDSDVRKETGGSSGTRD